MTKKTLVYYLFLIFLLVGADQTSKTLLISHLKTEPGSLKEIFPFLDFVYAWNYGISFGLFREYHQYSNYVFLAFNSFIIIYLSYIFYNSNNIFFQIGLAFIIGGALGNLLDRIFRGAVFDFLYFHYHELSFPAFNLADSFITIGACCFIYSYIIDWYREDKKA
jgi:signal peptidase II